MYTATNQQQTVIRICDEEDHKVWESGAMASGQGGDRDPASPEGLEPGGRVLFIKRRGRSMMVKLDMSTRNDENLRCALEPNRLGNQ